MKSARAPGNLISFQPARPRLPPCTGSAKKPSRTFCSSIEKNSWAGTASNTALLDSISCSAVSCASAASWHEGFALRLLHEAAGGIDSQPIDLLRRELGLIAHRGRRVGVERPLHVPELAGGPGRVHLPVDASLGHAGFHRPWARCVVRNQSRAGGVDEGPFACGEEARRIGARCRVARGRFALRGRRPPGVAPGKHRDGEGGGAQALEQLAPR